MFRGRQLRVVTELTKVLTNCCGLPSVVVEPRWFLSSAFFEAFSEESDLQLGCQIPKSVVDFIRARPAELLFDYLNNLPENVRTASVENFSAGLEGLRLQVEGRRTKHAGESASMRKRIYSALILIDQIERINQVANELGVTWSGVSDIGSTNGRRIVEEVPAYYIEREIAVRLEAQNRPIHENDFRDMQSFCAVIPYADMVIGENQFVNLARQAGLSKKFHTLLETDIFALNKIMSQISTGIDASV